MTITTYGYDNADITVLGFETLLRYAIEGGYRHNVASGFTVTPGGGTRQTSIAAGVAVSPGVYVSSDATTTLTHSANATGANRVDYVVVRVNAATSTTTIAVVTGTSSTAPSLTQTLGGIWEIPLARVTVPNAHATVFNSGHIVTAKPLPRRSYFSSDSVDAATIGHANSGTVVASVALTDPGWQYRVRVTGVARVKENVGFAKLRAVVGGTTFGAGISPRLNHGGLQPVTVVAVSDLISGAATVQLVAEPIGMDSGSLEIASDSVNAFTVEQIPA